MRDIYTAYGYDFHYYHGEQIEAPLVKEKLKGLHHLDQAIYQSCKEAIAVQTPEQSDHIAQKYLERYSKFRVRVIEMLMQMPQFISADGQPLRLMKKLELDPTLLDQPLYH